MIDPDDSPKGWPVGMDGADYIRYRRNKVQLPCLIVMAAAFVATFGWIALMVYTR